MPRKPRLALCVTRRLASQAGYTLIELLVVMTLLTVVMGAVASGFTSATRLETDETARANDRESAREALERMRTDIHCASGAATQPNVDSSGNPTGTGYTLQLSVSQNQCSGVTSLSNGVQWCSYSVGGSTTRYAIYRTVSGNCGPADALFQVDYITSYGSITGGNFWSVPACTSGRLQSVTVNMPVNQTPITRPDATYDLTDSIAMRNAPVCP